MNEIKVEPMINITKEKITNDKPENNFIEVLIYLAIYLSIGFAGLLINYLKEKFSGNKVSNL